LIVQGKVSAVASNHPQAPKEGDTASHVWATAGSRQKKEQGAKTWKQFLTAVCGDGIETMDDDELQDLSEEIIDEDSLVGEEMVVRVREIDTEAGGIFTKHFWEGFATDKDRDEIEASAKKLAKEEYVDPRDDDDEEDEKPRRRRKRADDDEEDEKPRRRRKRADDDEEDEKPRRRRKRADDDEEDEKPRRRSRR